jgi:hypothetical protein
MNVTVSVSNCCFCFLDENKSIGTKKQCQKSVEQQTMILFLFFLLLTSAWAVRVDSLTRCGTATIDLKPLKAAKDYVLPVGAPCTLPQCSNGKLPWNVFFNICQPVQKSGPAVSKCRGAQACQQWPGDSASLGQFSSVNYTDIAGGVLLNATGGTFVDGIGRQMMLQILCAPQSDPYPTFTQEDPIALIYNFSWNRTEVCPQNQKQSLASRVNAI